jgi:transglutaminase-like putative cysteine protease
MYHTRFRRAAALLLVLCLPLCLLTGCFGPVFPFFSEPNSGTEVPVSTGTVAVPTEPAAPEAEPSEAPTVPAGPMPENAVSWQSIFWDSSLPAGGWIGEGQAAFYVVEPDGTGSVLAMDCDELLDRVAAMEPLPRTHYYEELLDESYKILFAAFDLALELGSRKFCFSTESLRSSDVTKNLNYISYTFPLANGMPSYTCSKEYRGADGGTFHYMTVSLVKYDQADMEKYLEAMQKARSVLAEMPGELDELGKAKYLYRYVATNVSYDYDDYYDQEDWNCLYDALIKGSAVCTGYAEALYTLYNLAGIDCLYVTGYVDHRIVFGGHAWNLAKVNGDWYLFDATWDTIEGFGRYTPLLFGVSDKAAAYYAARDLSSFSASVAPACDKILDPEYLYFVPPV